MNLVTAAQSQDIDRQARDEWGFNSFSLIETAGRSCCRELSKAYPNLFRKKLPGVMVFCGTGNNGADALTMLRHWLVCAMIDPLNCIVYAAVIPEKTTAPGSLILSLKKMQVNVIEWGDPCRVIENKKNCIILDGITGTGLRCPLGGVQAEMAETINNLAAGSNFTTNSDLSANGDPVSGPLVVSVDVPSGISDDYKSGMLAVRADVTLAIEPQKICLYNPAARPFAGRIISVSGIFPAGLINRYTGPQLLDWENFPKEIFLKEKFFVEPASHKYDRGCTEIHAGSPGTAGAAVIAAKGAQAAGAGLVRVITDDNIYPIIAAGAGGVMVMPLSLYMENHGKKTSGLPKRFMPDSILLGPGWGRGALSNGPDRGTQLNIALESEKSGIPLIVDADGIYLTRDIQFNGSALLTPHIGEFAAMTGIDTQEILDQPLPLLKKTAAQKNAFILLKSHVMFIVSPDGRCGVIDGMSANLAAGGSGDLLAGFCAALAARTTAAKKIAARTTAADTAKKDACDLFDCAAAAAVLLIKAAKSGRLINRFIDPLELASKAADLAGRAWLAKGSYYE
ncbi:MAG: NAD(P)H-hydrate dehydratase [Treponema sp.]|nr:NAD(P)H-hydrate dehydratase [Treponema sp.]